MKTNHSRREYLIWCCIGVVATPVILILCSLYQDLMTSVGLAVGRVFPGLFGMLILLIAVLLVLKCLRDFHDQKDVTAKQTTPRKVSREVGIPDFAWEPYRRAKALQGVFLEGGGE